MLLVFHIDVDTEYYEGKTQQNQQNKSNALHPLHCSLASHLMMEIFPCVLHLLCRVFPGEGAPPPEFIYNLILDKEDAVPRQRLGKARHNSVSRPKDSWSVASCLPRYRRSPAAWR